MSIPRSDLPRVGALEPRLQREAVDAMWRAYRRAEGASYVGGDAPCPVSWVATFAEVLEAALAALERPLRWRGDVGADAGDPRSEPARPDDAESLEWTVCGEPDGHPSHRWTRERWTRWRFCTGRPLSDREFLVMHPLPQPHAFVDAALAGRGVPSEPELARRLEREVLVDLMRAAADEAGPGGTEQADDRDEPTLALAESAPFRVTLDTRVPPGVVFVGAAERIEAMLADWTRGRWPEQPLTVAQGEVAVLRVERAP